MLTTIMLVHVTIVEKLIMPRWAEPQRHTVVVVCECVCVSFCEIVVSHISAIAEN